MGRSVYNRNIFKTTLYIYIFQDEKCRLMHNLSLSMGETPETHESETLFKIPCNG